MEDRTVELRDASIAIAPFDQRTLMVNDDEARGRHSRIPHCCRTFYRVWIAFRRSRADRGVGAQNARWERRIHHPATRYAQYILCPGCRHLAAYNRLRICAVDCAPDCPGM